MHLRPLTLALALAATLVVVNPVNATATVPLSQPAASPSPTSPNATPTPPTPTPTPKPSPTPTPKPTEPTSANARIAKVLGARTVSRVLGTHTTMTVWDPATRTSVFKRRANESLRGASTTKVLTAVGALTALGPDRRLPTVVRAGATRGTVVIVAGGDPLLSSANLRSLAARTATALRASGSVPKGTRIRVIADDTLFTGSGRSRGWDRDWLPGEVRPVNAFTRDDRKLMDPTGDVGRYFARALSAKGVASGYGGRVDPKARPRTTGELARVSGHTVAENVRRMLTISDNDVAEMMFRHIAIARKKPATWAGARAAQTAQLRSLGIPLAGVRVIDGSGLSLEGRVTAPALQAALILALSPRQPRLAHLRAWLPVSGRTGTLRASAGRFQKSPARCAIGRVQAKTGTLADAIGLAGYAVDSRGNTRVFVAIVNQRPTRYTRNQTRRAVDGLAASVTGCW